MVRSPGSTIAISSARSASAAALLPVFHIEDDTIYALPSRSLAHLMKPEELPGGCLVNHPQALVRYVAAIEDTSRPSLTARWKDTDTLELTGPVRAADVVAVQVSDDAGWHATQDGHPIGIDEDRLGFMVLHPSPSAAAHIELRYRGTIEQKVIGGIEPAGLVGGLARPLREQVPGQEPSGSCQSTGGQWLSCGG